MAQPSPLTFKVIRRSPELIVPVNPTPHEHKLLSDIDDQDGLRFQIPVIQFYRNDESMRRKKIDPVKVIREALAKTLVYYYPFAGRLREGANRKLMVECTGEGVLFIEGDADVTLEQFGDELQPPFPCLEELLFDVPGSSGILDCPLLLLQVTRLRCGGFILAFRLNHTMSDARGIIQFMTALSEIARGAHAPSISPVWQRHLLSADSLQVTYPQHKYNEMPNIKATLLAPQGVVMAKRSFFFGSKQIHSLQQGCVPHHLQKCSTFELITACIWRCRTHALQLDLEEEVRLLCLVDAHKKFDPPLPLGYYGNTVGFAVALTSAGELCQNSIEYAIRLIKKAKANITREHVRSVANLMVAKGQPYCNITNALLISDVRHSSFHDLDFGWGKAVYGGPTGADGPIPGLATYYLPSKNKNGENGTLVPISLPVLAMEKFVVELDSMFKNEQLVTSGTLPFITSAL